MKSKAEKRRVQDLEILLRSQTAWVLLEVEALRLYRSSDLLFAANILEIILSFRGLGFHRQQPVSWVKTS